MTAPSVPDSFVRDNCPPPNWPRTHRPVIDPSGVLHPSRAAAARAYGVSAPTIGNWLRRPGTGWSYAAAAGE